MGVSKAYHCVFPDSCLEVFELCNRTIHVWTVSQMSEGWCLFAEMQLVRTMLLQNRIDLMLLWNTGCNFWLFLSKLSHLNFIVTFVFIILPIDQHFCDKNNLWPYLKHIYKYFTGFYAEIILRVMGICTKLWSGLFKMLLFVLKIGFLKITYRGLKCKCEYMYSCMPP